MALACLFSSPVPVAAAWQSHGILVASAGEQGGGQPSGKIVIKGKGGKVTDVEGRPAPKPKDKDDKKQ